MMLLEHEAKRILAQSGLAIPSGVVASPGPAPFLPAVIKSQVPVGGRGKLGGVRMVHNQAEFDAALTALENLEIKGYRPRTILAEQALSIHREFYLSLMVERDEGGIVMVAHPRGGVEVEANDEGGFMKIPIDTPNFDVIGQQLAECFDLAEKAFELGDISQKLVACLRHNDASLIEINPLVLTSDNHLIAADCKLVLDQSAAFRHKDWNFETPIANANFVTLKPDGEVATIANGAGLAMATVDAIEDAGLNVANFLDVGGGASEASVLASFEKIMRYSSVRAIVINIFAGITRCDEVARAIISADSKIPGLPPLFIRLAGTNSEEANQLLADAQVKHSSSLEACIALAKTEVKR